MNGKFTVTIELGNDAMRTKAHLSTALKSVALLVPKQESGIIRDINGNKVGEWALVKE